MPSITTVPSDELFEPTESFTVLPSFATDRDTKKPLKNINIVKPVQRQYLPKQDETSKKDFSFRVIALTTQDDDERDVRRRKKKPHPAIETSVQSHTILDPHFSRHLDLKLRRLKEKEIIAERISRRNTERQRALLAEPTVIPKVNINKVQAKNLSVSQPNLKASTNSLNVPQKEKSHSSDGGSPSGKSPDKLNASGDRSKKGSRNNVGSTIDERPLFITTVRKGEFLPPPPSMATLLGITSCERTGAGVGVPTLIYSYSSRPKVVGSKAAEHAKNPLAAKNAIMALASMTVAAAGLQPRAGQYGNLMSDRRIVRGSTTGFHASCLPPGLENGDDEAAISRGARVAAARRRAMARRKLPAPPGIISGNVPRRHEPVQTDPYLEELYDKGHEMEIGIQTDLMLERVETPTYISSRNGSDAATQIIPGELFDFEAEVEPVLEVLVGNTIEQAIAECLEEEELAHQKKQAIAANELRAQAAASAKYRQRYFLRLHNDKEKRLAEEDEIASQLESERRAAASSLVKTHLPPLLPAVMKTLREQGYLGDSSPDMDDTFLPWLMGEVTQEVESMITNREMLMDIVKEVIETRAELYRAMAEDGEISSTTTYTSQKHDENLDTLED